MPLYEYACQKCKKRFEQITSSNANAPEPHDELACPWCGSKEVEKLISRFAVSGQGDLRESTVHGCHGCHSGHKHGSGNHSGSDAD